jgi:hypothetical protein
MKRFFGVLLPFDLVIEGQPHSFLSGIVTSLPEVPAETIAQLLSGGQLEEVFEPR